ncbi:TolC family protein [Pontibacter oryzae]|uniref:TolC family protein n=1 Tax=Pontibacter oryzae TaxID=2304593 RepID=A0A399RS96_9BACT|nr:TolC family protein [Pontibacter oryzae]RIJ33988.1 TolC family protein [Pontibacter oryzae]
MKKFSTKALLQKLGGLAFCLSLAIAAQAQEPLTLEQSLELARQHNVGLRQARYNSTKANISVKRSKYGYLPSITANVDAYRVNGLTFDNVSGQIKRGNTTSSNPYLQGQVVLFDGFAKLFELKKAQQQAEATPFAEQQAEIDLETNITGYFLQALVDRENIHISEGRITLLEGQLDKMEKLERAGVRAEDEVYQIKAQLAAEKSNLITHHNNYRKARLQLAQEMNVESGTSYNLQMPATPEQMLEVLPSEQQVMAQALGFSPMVKSYGAYLAAAKSNYKLAKSSFSPTLTLDGMLGSNYSTNILQDPENGNLSTMPYFNQLDLNQRKVVRISLSITIFNGLSRHFDAQTARLDLRNAELDYIASQNQLRLTVQQAYQDVLTAREKYTTVIANLDYTQRAFDASKRRYDLGTIDFYAYMESLNNLNKTQAELLQSKLEFYFKKRILELYQG